MVKFKPVYGPEPSLCLLKKEIHCSYIKADIFTSILAAHWNHLGNQRGWWPFRAPSDLIGLGLSPDTDIFVKFTRCTNGKPGLRISKTGVSQTHFQQGPHEPCGCLQKAEIILGLCKCNFSLTVKELKLHSAL